MISATQGGFAIAAFGHNHVQHLAFMVNSAPELVQLTLDLHEYLVHVPSPLGHALSSAEPFLLDLVR